MSRQNISARNAFFRNSMAKNGAIQKKRKELKLYKSGEILPDPKEVVEITEENVPDPEVVSES